MYRGAIEHPVQGGQIVSVALSIRSGLRRVLLRQEFLPLPQELALLSDLRLSQALRTLRNHGIQPRQGRLNGSLLNDGFELQHALAHDGPDRIPRLLVAPAEGFDPDPIWGGFGFQELELGAEFLTGVGGSHSPSRELFLLFVKLPLQPIQVIRLDLVLTLELMEDLRLGVLNGRQLDGKLLLELGLLLGPPSGFTLG